MIIIVSPAKSLNFEEKEMLSAFSLPLFINKAQELVNILQKLSVCEIRNLLKISDSLAELNKKRYALWSQPFTLENSKQAVFAFKGDVYKGLDIKTLKENDVNFAQNHLRILSGLYGILKPLDLIQPYRLEMGTKLKNKNGENLYRFWKKEIASFLNKNHAKQTIINLSSEEYFKAVDRSYFNGKILSPIFKDKKNGNFKIISFYAKKARGMMARYIIKNRIKKTEEIKGFDYGGYVYNESMSTAFNPVFTRNL